VRGGLEFKSRKAKVNTVLQAVCTDSTSAQIAVTLAYCRTDVPCLLVIIKIDKKKN